MTNQEIAKMIRGRFFGDRGTDLEAALQYALDLISHLEPEGVVKGLTGMYVVLNTIANILEADPRDEASGKVTGAKPQ
jgi:hypothetical protein